MFFAITKFLLFWKKFSEVNRGLSFFLPANGSRVQLQSENLCWKKKALMLSWQLQCKSWPGVWTGFLGYSVQVPLYLAHLYEKIGFNKSLLRSVSDLSSFLPFLHALCYKHPFRFALPSVPSLLLCVRKQHGANTPLQGSQDSWETPGTGGNHLGWSEKLLQWRNMFALKG